MLDTVFIENIITESVIGVYNFEKSAPQKIIISLELGTDISHAARTDDVKYALDYNSISSFVDNYIRYNNCDLIETLAEKLVHSLFNNFNMQTIKLRLQKPGAILFTQQVGLVIFRSRENYIK